VEEQAQNPPFGIDEQVDLLEYLHAILRVKYRIVVIAMIGAAIVFGLSRMVDDIFIATAVVAVNIKDKPGGVSPKEYRASDALGLIEHDFIIEGAHSNERDRLMARMRSMRFSQLFIEENDLLPYIFHKQWDKESGNWLEGFKPDMRLAGQIFGGSMRGLDPSDETGLLRVHFKTRDPELSARLANAFVDRFNRFIRDNEAGELKARRDYLENRLKEVENIELHRSIFRLLETQLAAESLLYARRHYPLEVIQPAFPPLNKASPQRKKWAALSFVALLMLGVMGAIGSVLVGKLREGLRFYQDESIRRISHEPGEEGQGRKGEDWLDADT
jgi:hypothetical protein